VKIKAITNENLIQYTAELKGNIILSIDNVKATDIETVSKLINSKEESQSVRLEMIKKGENLQGYYLITTLFIKKNQTMKCSGFFIKKDNSLRNRLK
jgi:hypothetical protein